VGVGNETCICVVHSYDEVMPRPCVERSPAAAECCMEGRCTSLVSCMVVVLRRATTEPTQRGLMYSEASAQCNVQRLMVACL
jgi:hypothetical protein